MPKYLVRVSASYTGEISYEVEADTPEKALEIARSGDDECSYEETQCDRCEWEDADVSVMRDESSVACQDCGKDCDEPEVGYCWRCLEDSQAKRGNESH